ncbi:hypothetical protein [Ohtaekwangia koreensis]|uniref:Uncharacterized protein n=1 Tax=Ohtaekwangia koreensis TaxID=688867 RepID=A0A1T5LTY9_9BACT|nr:hypothetical protein [Ohtaekwangia koreensis]SKC79028.1 hypothetical protein SAMN05660236_3858 [Ohtaekwangia koreensis]
MKEISIVIENCEKDLDATDFDLLCVEKIEHIDKVTNCSLATITLDNGKKDLRVKFEWKEDSGIEESDFLYIPETATLFFRSQNQWGAIDIENKTLKRHESSMWEPFIHNRGDYILIEDDLKAESTKLNGDKIDSVPIDPPTESKEFKDWIEYNSPVYGRQVLKIK